MMVAQGVVVHGSQYRDAVLVLSHFYAIVHCARGGTLDGVHSGEELAADKYVTTGKNSATGGWIAKPTIQ